MTSLPDRARQFAAVAHAGQRRSYTGEAYISHPAAVVELVKSRPHTDAMIATAWLHDVVEDTDVTVEAIRQIFGTDIATLVEHLTDVSRPEDGNRAARKAIDRAHIAAAPPEAKTIKLADLIDNTRTIAAHDPKFAKVYLAEKRLLLEVLREGDPVLWQIAFDLTREA